MQVYSPMHDTVVVVVVIVVMMVTMICSIVLQGSLIFIRYKGISHFSF